MSLTQFKKQKKNKQYNYNVLINIKMYCNGSYNNTVQQRLRETKRKRLKIEAPSEWRHETWQSRHFCSAQEWQEGGS